MKSTSWGKSVHINLSGCPFEMVSDGELLRTYIQDVIKRINMVAHGECHIERFGTGSLEGYSAMQFIETSSITVHMDETAGRAFIDIFSCKDFDTEDASLYSKEYFKAQEMNQTTLER